MANLRKSKIGVNSPILEFISKYWAVLIGLLFFAPTILKWFKDLAVSVKANAVTKSIEQNNIENQNFVPKTIQEKVDKILFTDGKITDKKVRDRLQSRAIELSNHFGFNHDTGNWYDVLTPRYWTENDKEIEIILVKETHNFRHLEKLYYGVYTQSRNLSQDILKLLDKQNLKNVRTEWAKYGKNYL